MVSAGPEVDPPASTGWSDVVDNLPIGVFRSTPDGRILQANRALAALLGFDDVGSLLGVNARDLYTDPSIRDVNVAATEAGADRYDLESTLRRLDGSTVAVRVNSRVRRDADGSIRFYEGIIEDLEERRRLDRALRFEEAILGAALDGSPTGFALMDRERRALRVNDAMCRMLGRTQAEVLGTPLEVFLHPEDEPKGLRRFEELLSGTRDGYRVERRLVQPDGTVVWALLTVSGVRDDSGEVVAVLSQAVDVSERRLAEDKLLRSEAANRALIDAISDPIFLVDRAGTIVDFHPGADLDPALPPEEFLGRSLHDVHEPEVAARFVDAINRVIDWGEPETIEYPMSSVGEGRWFAADLSRVGEDEVIALVYEVTDRLRQRRAAERWEREVAAMMTAAPHHILVISGDGRLVEVRASSQTHRMPTAAWLGRTVAELIPERAEEIGALIRETIATGEVGRFEVDFTTDAPRRYQVVMTRSGDDEVLAAVRDLGEEGPAERALRLQLSARDEFVASVSHELRDPLATVVGLATEIRDRLDDFGRDELAELVGLIADQGGDMAAMVEDLLVATRADLTKLDVAAMPVDLEGAVAAVLRAWPQRNIEVLRPVSPALAWADAGRVRQVIRNLLTNAFRYGGERIEVEIDVPTDGLCRLLVRDDGAPIRDDVRQAMFGAYEHHGMGPGVGLGLTVARKLARLMGGDLSYDHAGGWSTFTLTLPESVE
jgi:PAS domain S-box-containing protein